MPYKVGILTISDTCSHDASKDKSGSILSSEIVGVRSQGLYEVTSKAIVPDDADTIQKTLRSWIDGSSSRVDLVLCTGGTGFGVRDVTPEAVIPLIDKHTGGLTHALIQHSLGKTPMAALSRMTSGIRHRRSNPSTLCSAADLPSDGSCLILALPGSSRAVQECLEVLIGPSGVLPHALELLQGHSGGATHAAMHLKLTGTETDSGAAKGSEKDKDQNETHHHHNQQHHHHHHHHNHHHNHGHHAPKPRTLQDGGFYTHDPSQAVSLRKRISPYPIITMEDASSLIMRFTRPNPAEKLPTSANLGGYILAEDIRAPRKLPPRATTNVDGYAVRSSSTPPGAYRVLKSGEEFQPNSVFRVNTGQAIPTDTDAVLMVEDSDLLEECDGEETLISVKAQVDSGENVRQPGSDVEENQLVLRKGTKISELGGEIGTLAFLGIQNVRVVRKPRIAIISTGNELFDIEKSPESSATSWGFRVYDANRPSLNAALRGAGFDVVDLGIVDDNMERTVSLLNRGLEEADVVISTGGTSMGESDLLKPIIERRLNEGKIHFGRVAMKPGKPTTFASALSSSGEERILFALPGNPASALVCFYVFVLPALRKISGYPEEQCPLSRVRVRLQDAMRCDPRPEFHRVIISSQNGELWASSTGSQRSSGMHSMATANGLVCVPTQTQGNSMLPSGHLIEAIILGPIVQDDEAGL